MSANFRENKKIFWKEVDYVRKTVEQMGTSLKGVNGEGEQTERRWREYFEGYLNVFDRVTDGGV